MSATSGCARAFAGDGALADHSRRPHRSPNHCDAAVEARVLVVREAHPAWGARKIAHCLKRDGVEPPARSTVHEILRRHGLVQASGAWTSGAISAIREGGAQPALADGLQGLRCALADGASCHPLTVIDDHSRYALCLGACANQQSQTVQQQLTTTFRRYGLPQAFFVDNGSPWGDPSGARLDASSAVWLLKLGVDLVHMPGPTIRRAAARTSASIAP